MLASLRALISNSNSKASETASCFFELFVIRLNEPTAPLKLFGLLLIGKDFTSIFSSPEVTIFCEDLVTLCPKKSLLFVDNCNVISSDKGSIINSPFF